MWDLLGDGIKAVVIIVSWGTLNSALVGEGVVVDALRMLLLLLLEGLTLTVGQTTMPRNRQQSGNRPGKGSVSIII